jgi:hypothetical protein
MKIEGLLGPNGARGKTGDDFGYGPGMYRLSMRGMWIAVFAVLTIAVACGTPEPQMAPP